MRKLEILSHCGPHVKDGMGWVMTKTSMKVPHNVHQLVNIIIEPMTFLAYGTVAHMICTDSSFLFSTETFH